MSLERLQGSVPISINVLPLEPITLVPADHMGRFPVPDPNNPKIKAPTQFVLSRLLAWRERLPPIDKDKILALAAEDNMVTILAKEEQLMHAFDRAFHAAVADMAPATCLALKGVLGLTAQQIKEALEPHVSVSAVKLCPLNPKVSPYGKHAFAFVRSKGLTVPALIPISHPTSWNKGKTCREISVRIATTSQKKPTPPGAPHQGEMETLSKLSGSFATKPQHKGPASPLSYHFPHPSTTERKGGRETKDYGSHSLPDPGLTREFLSSKLHQSLHQPRERCLNFVQGKCRNQDAACRYLHQTLAPLPEDAPALCKDFVRFRSCNRGKSCPFSHPKPLPPQTDLQTPVPNELPGTSSKPSGLTINIPVTNSFAALGEMEDESAEGNDNALDDERVGAATATDIKVSSEPDQATPERIEVDIEMTPHDHASLHNGDTDLGEEMDVSHSNSTSHNEDSSSSDESTDTTHHNHDLMTQRPGSSNVKRGRVPGRSRANHRGGDRVVSWAGVVNQNQDTSTLANLPSPTTPNIELFSNDDPYATPGTLESRPPSL